MPTSQEIANAQKTLRQALLGGDEALQGEALSALSSLIGNLHSIHGKLATRAFPACELEQQTEPPRRVEETTFINRLLDLLVQQPGAYIHIVLRLFHTRWSTGGEGHFSNAPPFEEVRPKLLAAMESAGIDVDGSVALLIGRYGPEAASILPEFVKLLREKRTDCSIAPGLTWAVYQIGGMHPHVRDVLMEVAAGEDSCPHSRPIAQEILRTNNVQWGDLPV